MLFLILYVNHFVTLFAQAYVAGAVGLVEIDAVDGEGVVAVGALLGLVLYFHLIYYSNHKLFL